MTIDAALAVILDAIGPGMTSRYGLRNKPRVLDLAVSMAVRRHPERERKIHAAEKAIRKTYTPAQLDAYARHMAAWEGMKTWRLSKIRSPKVGLA